MSPTILFGKNHINYCNEVVLLLSNVFTDESVGNQWFHPSVRIELLMIAHLEYDNEI
jgi:hypothetical protein